MLKKILLCAVSLFLAVVFFQFFNKLDQQKTYFGTSDFEKFHEANSAVSIEAFITGNCPVCGALINELPEILADKFPEEQVLFTIWNIDDISIMPYYNELTAKILVPRELRGFVPIIVVNKSFFYAGYDFLVKEFLICDVDAILNNKPLPYGGNVVKYSENKKRMTGQEKLKR